ncbi:hypothetical protein ACTNEU_09100 [Ellagibacter isourolithinifaciens]|uniref:hypothetical protein n=1 Tax=Ellagibacter isourolithinifaciens TaxID=2137581 RepID=UPI003F8B39D3
MTADTREQLAPDEDKRWQAELLVAKARSGEVGPVQLEMRTHWATILPGDAPTRTHHQVLYRDGQLWHDPHPSRDGLLAVEEAFVLRPPPAAGHDHDPTPQEDQ